MRDFTVQAGADATLRGSEVGEGPAVVFLHAGVADRRSWFEVMELVAREGYRAIAYDQRGYGDTEAGNEPFSHRDDLRTVLDDRAVDDVVVVGASRGGQIALDFSLAMPSRASALMLVGSAPKDAPFGPPHDAVTRLATAIDEADERGDHQSVNELEAQLWLDGPTAEPGRVAGALRDLFLDMNGRALAADPIGEAAPFDDTWERLPALDLPVSIVVGDLDVPGLVAAAKAVADRVPNATYRVLDDTAHLPMLEHPTRIAQEVLDLLTRRA